MGVGEVRTPSVLEGPAGDLHEYVFESGGAQVHRTNQASAGEGFNQGRNELMASGEFDAEAVFKDLRGDLKTLLNGGGERPGVVGREGDDIRADAGLEGGWGVAGGESALIHDGQAIAVLGFIHEVSGEEDRYSIGFADGAEMLPEINACGRIEAGGGFIKKQEARAGEQALGEFNPAAHSA